MPGIIVLTRDAGTPIANWAGFGWLLEHQLLITSLLICTPEGGAIFALPEEGVLSRLLRIVQELTVIFVGDGTNKGNFADLRREISQDGLVLCVIEAVTRIS